MMRIYVGNLHYDMIDSDLKKAFETFGTVDDATIIIDRETGRSRGFGFVEMPNTEEARKAVEGMNGKEFLGRLLKVNEAKPRRGGGRRF